MDDFLAYKTPRNGFYHLDMVFISQRKCVLKRKGGGRERERERERERFC